MLESLQLVRHSMKTEGLTKYINLLRKMPIRVKIHRNKPSVDWNVGKITKIKKSADGKIKNLQLIIEGLHTWNDQRNFVFLIEM